MFYINYLIVNINQLKSRNSSKSIKISKFFEIKNLKYFYNSIILFILISL